MAKFQALKATSEVKLAIMSTLVGLICSQEDRDNKVYRQIFVVTLKEWTKPSQNFRTVQFRVYVHRGDDMVNISKEASTVMGWMYSSEDRACQSHYSAISNADELRHLLYGSDVFGIVGIKEL